MAATLTRSRSWTLRGAGGEGCRRRGGAEAGEANAARAEYRDAGLVLEGGLRRVVPEMRREEAAGPRLGVADLNRGADPRRC
jgi:hypothetical protein